MNTSHNLDASSLCIFSALQQESLEVASKFIIQEYQKEYSKINSRVSIEEHRIKEALVYWKKDIEKLTKEINSDKKEGDKSTLPSHFKQSGHLCYWLRRMSPILSAVKPLPSTMNLHKETHRFEEDSLENKLLIKFANEYIPFNLLYNICRNFETNNKGKEIFIEIDESYMLVVSQFLKEKNVSPHALTLIYQSLFMDR